MSETLRYRLLGALLLLTAAAWSGYALFADAPVVDEAPHLAAGISYVELLDYRLNPEHPPLEKLAAGIGAHFAHPILPTDTPWWSDGINEQWRAGAAVLWDGRNDPGTMLALGRLGVTLLNFLLLIIAWRVIASRTEEKWATAFLALTVISPFFLGHAHLVTTDIAAACTGALACAAFAKFMEKNSWRTGAIAAIAFGVAQLAKFSLILLIPTFLLVALIAAWQAHGFAWKKMLVRLVLPSAVMLAGFACVVYPTYLVLTWNGSPQNTHRDASFLLSSFAGGPKDKLIKNPMRYVADATISLAQYKVTQPIATYGLGVLMVIQRSAGGSTGYFNGHVGASGSILYFPLVYLTKETIPALAIVGTGLVFLIRRKKGSWRQIGREVTPALVLGTFAILYIASTLKSSLNIGVRHIFPVIPIAYLFALTGWKEEIKKKAFVGHILVLLLILHVAACASSLPYPLAFYNKLAGGTAHGYTIAADSNYDWGQDALRLRQWIDAHPEAGPVAVNIFGGTDAQALLGDRAIAWWSARGNPEEYGIHWIAISNSLLLTATQKLSPGEPRFSIDEYRWLQTLKQTPYGKIPEPDTRAGTSIFLYKLN